MAKEPVLAALLREDKRTLPTADRGAPPSPEGISVNMEELLRTLDDRADQ